MEMLVIQDAEQLVQLQKESAIQRTVHHGQNGQTGACAAVSVDLVFRPGRDSVLVAKQDSLGVLDCLRIDDDAEEMYVQSGLNGEIGQFAL